MPSDDPQPGPIETVSQPGRAALDTRWRELERAPMALGLVDAHECRLECVNDALSALLRAQHAKTERSPLSMWLPDFEPRQLRARASQAAAKGEVTVERQVRRADGELFCARVLFRPFDDAGGPLVLVHVDDISAEVEQRQGLVALMQSTAMLRGDEALQSLCAHLANLLAVRAVAIVEHGAEGCTTRSLLVDGEAAEQARYAFSAEPYQDLAADTAVVVEAGAKDLLADAGALAALGAASYVGLPLCSPDEIVGHICAIDDHDYFDTARVRAMLAICAPLATSLLLADRRSQDEGVRSQRLRHAERLDSLSLMAGRVAHDFNNMLTTMMGHADLARMLVAPESEVAKSLTRVSRAAAKASELCDQMLAYAGRGTHDLHMRCVNTLLRTLEGTLAATVPARVRLQFSLADTLPLAKVDTTHVTQMLVNLVSNAADAIGDNSGRIDISTGLVHWDGRLTAANATGMMAPGDYVCIEVRDTGCGMAPALMERIFDPFFSTKDQARGFGLASVIGMVRGHQGGLMVESTPGEGSSFSVLLPVGLPTERSSNRGAHSTEHRDGSPAQTKRSQGEVLVVDDEPGVRGTVCRYLRHLGYQTDEAMDGMQALERMQQHRYELVLMDLEMPRIRGSELLERMRDGDGRAIPVILMSGYAQTSLAQELSLASDVQFVQKPFSLADLEAALSAVFPD